MMPIDVIIVGQALESRGMVAFNTTEGLGLNTFGFLWPCEGIWATTDDTCPTSVWTPVRQVQTITTETCTDIA